MAVIGEGISHRGLVVEATHWPFYVTGAVTQADQGKAVAIDPAQPRSVKLAGDGDVVVGQLVSFEDRKIEGIKVGTVAMHGGFQFTGVSGHSISVGDTVVGSATAGQVKAAAAADYTQNIVTAVDGDAIEVLFK